jgi:hypothetical protein
VGGPRNYKWLNTNQIEKTWQQMDLAYQRGARALWIVNVGDIKPMEFPLSFFLAQAWDPEAMTPAALANYPEQWARATFGPKQAKEIAALVTRYGQLASLRKPELLDADSFPLGKVDGATLDGGEFGLLNNRWGALEEQLSKVKAKVPDAQRDAFFQLVEHPISALSNLYALYYAVAWNRKMADANDLRATPFADAAERLFKRDQELADQYHALNGGKWDGMMLQTHIGYTTWQQPDKQVMPAVRRVSTDEVSVAINFVSPGHPRDIEAAWFSRAHGGKGLTWQLIPNLGHGLGAVLALPQGLPATTEADAIYLEYPAILEGDGVASVQLHLLPTLNTQGGVDVRVGVSLDARPLQILSMRLTPSPGQPTTDETRHWTQAVIDNDVMLEAKFPNVSKGRHVIKVWRIDDNVVLTRIVIPKP